MIRLIASDLDGTLLLGGAQMVSRKALALIKKLTDQGITFVAASGRQYPNLHYIFNNVRNQISYIAENGALVMHNEQLLYKDVMNHELAMTIIHDIDNRPGCEAAISTWNTCYLMPKDMEFYHHVKNVMNNQVALINSPEEIRDDILKISVYEKQGVTNSSNYFEKKWGQKVKSTISGLMWLDFVNPHVNKGSSLLLLMKELGITSEEVMTFGDNYNDIEMLSLAKYGFVMEHAVEDIKKRFTYVTKCVEDTLEELIEAPEHFHSS